VKNETFPTRFHAFVHSPEAAKINAASHAAWLDVGNGNEQKRHVTFYPGASMLKLSAIPGWQPYENESAPLRGRVSGFSDRSRSRLQETLARLKANALPLFVTLTYPAEFTERERDWKENLRAFAEWIKRHTAGAGSFVWKLEPQKRGAPHFHLMLYGVESLPWQIVAVRWAEIVAGHTIGNAYPVEAGRRGAAMFHGWVEGLDVAPGVAAHLKAGVQVKKVRSVRGVMAYAAKSYMGKVVEGLAGWEHVGRYWGVVNRKALPAASAVVLPISKAGAVRVRRVVRRWSRSKGRRVDYRGAVRIFTQDQQRWLDVIEVAERGRCNPRVTCAPLFPERIRRNTEEETPF